MDGQFANWVKDAEVEVRDKGLAASQQAIMLVGFGAVLSKLDSRVIRVDGKLVGSILLGIGTFAGALIQRMWGI